MIITLSFLEGLRLHEKRDPLCPYCPYYVKWYSLTSICFIRHFFGPAPEKSSHLSINVFSDFGASFAILGIGFRLG